MQRLKKAVEKSIKNVRNALTGTITSVIKSNKTVYVKLSNDEEIRDAKIISPYGFYSLPTNSNSGQLLFNNSGKKVSLIGVEHNNIPKDIEVGESIMYNPSSGSYIHLDNAGNINLNGKTPFKEMYTDITKFGAKGNGIDDDTKAFVDFNNSTTIHTAFVPDGEYNVTGFRLKTGKKLILTQKAKLIAKSNVNVVTMHEGSYFTGGEIITNKVEGFNKAAIYMNANDFPTLSIKTYVIDVQITGKFSQGYGIHLFNDGEWKGIDWVTVKHVNMYGYNKALFLQAKRPIANSCWINGNVFDDITFMYPDYCIYLEATSVFSHSGNEGVVNANYFVNINAQYGGNTKTCFYCEGGLNVYRGQAFDFPVEYIMHPRSEANIVETMFGYGVDDGIKNRVIRIGKFPQSEITQLGHVINPSFSGVQDDFLAYANKRHTVIQTSGPQPKLGKLENVFSYNIMEGGESRRDAYTTWGNTANNPVVIEIHFPFPINYWEMVQVNFIWDAPKKTKIEMYSTQWNIWMSMDERQNNTSFTVIAPAIQSIMFVDKLRFTFSSDTDFNINRISAFTSNYMGNTYLTRGGGEIYGDIGMNGKFLLNVGFADLKPMPQSEVYGNAIFVDSADKTLKFKQNGIVKTINLT